MPVNAINTYPRARGWIGGVCANLAAETGITVLLWRIGAVILLLAHAGVAILLYLAAALWQTQQRNHAERPDTHAEAAARAMRREILRRRHEEALARAFADLERR